MLWDFAKGFRLLWLKRAAAFFRKPLFESSLIILSQTSSVRIFAHSFNLHITFVITKNTIFWTSIKKKHILELLDKTFNQTRSRNTIDTGCSHKFELPIENCSVHAWTPTRTKNNRFLFTRQIICEIRENGCKIKKEKPVTMCYCVVTCEVTYFFLYFVCKNCYASVTAEYCGVFIMYKVDEQVVEGEYIVCLHGWNKTGILRQK